MFKTPQDILKIYREGYNATLFSERDVDSTLSKLRHPLFGDSARGLKDTGKGKIALPYKLVQKHDPTFASDEMQETGDCTSHGIRNASTISLVGDIEERFETEQYISRLATEVIYGYRGHSGQGMSVALAAEFVNNYGGIALRKKYGKYDLTNYNPNLGINWGRTGVPSSIIKEISGNQVATISLIQSVEELRDAIYNGYGVAVGSNFGFSNTRDKNGISFVSGRWNHCMCFGAMDDTLDRYPETLFLILNSWGEWNAGPRVLDQPIGSLWTPASIVEKMIKQKQTWVLGNVKGFPSKKINWDKLNEIL